jgi:glycosyltransferase involved in cell wall biosynthesis
MRISIITPTFNSADVLVSNLQSVATQNYGDIEQIVIDNCSTDGTLELIHACSHNIRVVSEKDSGIYDALNKGIRAATGEIIGILHSDDFYPSSDIISRVADAFNASDVDGIFGDVVMVERDDISQITRRWKSSDFSRRKFFNGWMPPHTGLFIRRSFYERCGLYDTSFRISGDYALMVRYFMLHNMRTKRINRVLVHMRRGGISDSSLRRRISMWREDARAWSVAGLSRRWYTIPLKVLRKAGQLFV